MVLIKSLSGVVIFSFALYLFLAGPVQREATLALIGASLDSRAITGLSIVGMVFGIAFTLRTLFDSLLNRSNVS
ncbi:MAG: hypothetical protein NZ578_08180 [Candidatus Binatia bacterium]|nr:hypothetical protein [Candidatus Binatia bacterium]